MGLNPRTSANRTLTVGITLIRIHLKKRKIVIRVCRVLRPWRSQPIAYNECLNCRGIPCSSLLNPISDVALQINGTPWNGQPQLFFDYSQITQYLSKEGSEVDCWNIISENIRCLFKTVMWTPYLLSEMKGLRSDKLLTSRINGLGSLAPSLVAVCHCHQDLLDATDINALMKDFVGRSDVRMNLFGKLWGFLNVTLMAESLCIDLLLYKAPYKTARKRNVIVFIIPMFANRNGNSFAKLMRSLI